MTGKSSPWNAIAHASTLIRPVPQTHPGKKMLKRCADMVRQSKTQEGAQPQGVLKGEELPLRKARMRKNAKASSGPEQAAAGQHDGQTTKLPRQTGQRHQPQPQPRFLPRSKSEESLTPAATLTESIRSHKTIVRGTEHHEAHVDRKLLESTSRQARKSARMGHGKSGIVWFRSYGQRKQNCNCNQQLFCCTFSKLCI